MPPEPDKSPLPPNPAEASRNSLLAGFRHSQRIRLEMPVGVYIGGADEVAIFERAKTLNVSAHGALLVLNTPVTVGKEVHLIHPQSKKDIQCNVSRILMVNPGGGMQIGVQFVNVSPDFWGIDSPPADWDPAWVPPPERKLLEPMPIPPWELEERPTEVVLQELVEKSIQDHKNNIGAGAVKANSKAPRISMSLMLVAAVAVLFTLWTVVARRSSNSASAASVRPSAFGIAPEDAALIPGVENFRLASADDFDADTVSWLRNSSRQVGGRIPGFYFGSFESNAYVLVGKANERRVVILALGEVRYNAEFPVVAVAARVPKELVKTISWADASPPDSNSDGLLIVRAADSPSSGVVLFLRGTQVISANPSNYREIFQVQRK